MPKPNKRLWSTLIAYIFLSSLVVMVGCCVTDEDCDNGLYCDGQESCLGNICVSGTKPCSGYECDEEEDECVFPCRPNYEICDRYNPDCCSGCCCSDLTMDICTPSSSCYSYCN